MAGQVFNYSLKFNADSAAATQAINQLQASLLEIQKKPLKLAVDQSSFTEAAKAAQELSMHLSNATDANTGKLNVNQLSSSLKKAGTDLTQLSTKLLEIGPSGAQAFTQLSSAIASANTPLKQMNGTLKSLGTSLANTAKWQLSSSLVHGFVGGLQSALNYAKDLNKSLTDIRIVTGYSTEQMAKFAEQANKAAKNLATTTTGYTNAALIYYQQGDSDAEVAKKAEITLKAANAAFGSSAKEMSEYLTAVWNSYQVGADELERYVDIMAALGAKTATSLEEIATSMQKVAATSNAVGVSMEQVSSIISTVSSVTRESAESIGTSFKTIFARMGDLKLGETLEDGIQLGQVSSQLAKIGVNILDVNGQMRDMGTVIEELMAKWGQLSAAEQVATAQVVAGKRQYTQLLALMENRDMYQKNMQIAENSTGFTNKQAEIYKESWAAASKEVRASLEGMWGQLIDDQTFIKATKGIAGFVSEISRLIQNIGGFKSALTLAGAALMNLYSPQVATKIDSMAQSLTKFFTVGKVGNQQQQFSQNIKNLKQQLAEAADNTQYTNSQKVSMEFDLQILELKERLANASKNLNKTQIAGAESVIGSLQTQKQIFVELYEAYEKAQAKVDATSQSMITKLTDQELYQNAARYQGLTDRGAAAKANQNLAIDAKKAYLQSGAQKQDPNLGANIKTLNDLNTAMSKMEVSQFSATLQGLGGNLKNAGISEMVNIFNELSTSVANAKKQAAEFGQSFKDIANSSRTTEQLKGDLLKFAQEANLTEEEVKQLKTELQTITTNADLDAWARKGGNAFELLKTRMNETSSATSPLVSYMRILRDILAQKFSPAALKELDDVLASLNSKTVNLDANIKKTGDDANKNFNKALQPASGFARILSNLSSVLMTVNSAISSITNMIDVWKDSDSTYWDKLSATLTAVGTAFMFVNTISTAVSTISDVIKAKKIAEGAAWTASGAAATAAGEAAGKATYKALGWIGAIILAIMGLVALISSLIANARKTAESIEQLSTATEKLNTATDVATSRIDKAISVMSQMQAIINDTTKSYQEQADALNELAGEYGLTVDIMDVMNGKYSTLESQIKRVLQGQMINTVDELTTQRKNAEAAYAKLFQPDEKGKYGIVLQKYTAKDTHTGQINKPNSNEALLRDNEGGYVTAHTMPHNFSMVQSDRGYTPESINWTSGYTQYGVAQYFGESDSFDSRLFKVTPTYNPSLAYSDWTAKAFGLESLGYSDIWGTRLDKAFLQYGMSYLNGQEYGNNQYNGDPFLNHIMRSGTYGFNTYDMPLLLSQSLNYGDKTFTDAFADETIDLSIDSTAATEEIMNQILDSVFWEGEGIPNVPYSDMEFSSEGITINGELYEPSVITEDDWQELMSLWQTSAPDTEFMTWMEDMVVTKLIEPITAGSKGGYTYGVTYNTQGENLAAFMQQYPNLLKWQDGRLVVNENHDMTQEEFTAWQDFQDVDANKVMFAPGGILAPYKITGESNAEEYLTAQREAKVAEEKAMMVQSALTHENASIKFLTDPGEKSAYDILNLPVNFSPEGKLELGKVGEGQLKDEYAHIKDFDINQIDTLADLLIDFDTYALASAQLHSLTNKARSIGQLAYVEAGESLSVTADGPARESIQKEIDRYSNAAWDAMIGDLDTRTVKIDGLDGKQKEITVTTDVLLQLNVADIEITTLDNDELQATISDQAYEWAYWASEQLNLETTIASRAANAELLTKENLTYEDYQQLTSADVLSKSGLNYTATNFASMSQVERELALKEADYRDREQLLAVQKHRKGLLEGSDGAIAKAQADYNAKVADYDGDYATDAARLAYAESEVKKLEKIKSILQNDGLSMQERQNALRDLDVNPDLYIDEAGDGSLKLVDGAIASINANIGTYNEEIGKLTEKVLEVKTAEDTLKALTDEQKTLESEIEAGQFAVNQDNRTKMTSRVTAFSSAYGRRSEMTMDELETLMVYAGDKQSQDALMAAYTSDNEAEWNRLAYENAIKYYNELEKQYTNDPEKLAIVLEQKEALQNNYYANLQAQEQKTYNYKKGLLQQDVEDQKEKVKILKELTKENAKLTDAQRKNLEQSGVDLTNYDKITDAQEKQIAGTKLYIAALGQQAMAEQAVIDKQKEGFDTMTSYGVTWKDYLLTNILGESDGELEAFVDLFNQDSSKELQKFINQSGMGQGLGNILLDIYNEAGGATLTQEDILNALNDKLAELEDAGEDVWANFRTYAAEALTSVLSIEQSAAQETVTIWESAYKAIAAAREGAMSDKTILESLYGDKNSLMAMIDVLTKNGYGTYSQVASAMTSKGTSLNGLNGMIDRTAYGKSLGLGGSIFATNRDATQLDWEAAAKKQAIDAAETIYAGMSDDVLLNAYGLVRKDGKYYRVQKDTNGKYIKDNGAYVTDATEVGATDLGMTYYNSIYGTADARAAAYRGQRNQYWAQDLIARQQATKYRQDKVSDWYGDMETLDKISRGERATDAAGIAREVALLNSLGNNITAQGYVTASPDELATYTSTRTSMTPIAIADFNKSYGAASLYETDAQGNILKDDKGNPILKQIEGLAYDDKGVLLGRTVTSADDKTTTTSMGNLSYEDRYAVHLQQQGLTSTDYTYEQYLQDYHGDKTFMTAAEKAAYEASKKHYNEKKKLDDTLKPHETAKTQLQELSELDLGSTDTEDNWNAIAAAVNEAGGSLKDWNEYSSVSARKTALLEANIAVAKDEAAKAKKAYTDASAEGSTLTEAEVEEYRQKWMQAEADVATNQQELEQQKLAAATGALDAQIAKWQELETAINSASSTLSGFLSNIESWGSASFATIAKLEAEIETINKLAGTNIQYTGFTGNATTDRNNMLRMNLDVNKANAQLLTQEQNFIKGITTDMETAINKNNTNMMDALSRDTWYTDLAGMKDDKGEAVFTDKELAKMAKAREEALKFNSNLSGAELWKEVKRILGEEDAELGVKLKINEGERKDLWKQMLSDQIAQEEAAAAEIVSVWENAFKAILKAKEALASGKSIGEMLLGDKDQMTALISMLREAGYNMNQIYDILNSPEEIGGWTSKISEMTTQQRADKYGASHENLLYNEDGTLALNQGTYAAYRERVEKDVRAEATDAYLISLLGAANYQRLTDENGKVIESDAEYQARIQAALTAKGDTVSTVTVKDGVITFTGDAGAALDNTVAEKMLAVTEQGWSDAIVDMMYEEYKTIKDKEASELAQVNNRIAHENETRTYAVGDKQYTEAQIKAYNQAFTSALEEYDANGNLEGLDTESKKLLQEYFGLDSLAEVEDLSLSQLETGATTTADAMLAAAAAALAYADAQYTALGYTKDGNGQWSKTVNSEQYDTWYATNGKQYKDDAAARAAFDKEQWDTWYAANGSKYANEEAARADYQPMPSQITIGLDETSQSTYDTLVDTVNTATDTTRTAMESINDRAINAVSEQASALGAINQAKAGSVEWYKGIDALREAYAGLEGAQDIITQLEQGTIDLNTANDRLADYTVNMIKNVGKLTDKQWDQYKALLRTNNITVDGYETIEDYIKAMEKARKKGQNFYKMLNKTGDGASELAEEMKAAAESTQDLNDDVNVASKALDFFDFGDYAKDSTDDIAKLKQGFQDLFSSPETLNAVNGFVDFINSKNVDWSTLFDASGAGASAEAMLSYLTNTVGMTQAQVDALCAAAGGDWTTVYNLLMNLFGSVNPESYNEAAAALQAFFASAGINITVPKYGGGGGGSGGNYTPPPSGGGGGGGGGDPKKLDKKRGRDEIERYHHLEKQLERVAEKLEEIDKIKERTFGKKHLDAIDDEIAALEKETKIQEEYLKEAETRYKNLDTKRMERLGGEFDEDGNLKNYEDVMKGLIDEYNAFITKYNNASAAEQKNMEEEKKRMDKWFEDQKQFLENYEDTIKIINEKKNKLEELKNKKSAAELEKITYKIEVITEFNDKDIEILEYYQSLYEDNLDLQGDFVRNLTQTSQEYVQNFSAISQAKADLDQKYKDGKITQADYIEGLQQLQESSLEYASAIEEVKKQMEEAYGNTLELAQDEMDKHNDALEHSSNLISSYISIMQLLGKGPNYTKLREFYQYQHAANLENIKTQRLWLETWEKEALYYEQKGTLTELEQKQYEELQEKIRESREELVSSTEEALSALQEAYENSINAIFKTLDENLGGAYDSLTQVAELYGYYQEKQANYVSTAKELHEISKLNRDIENSLEDVLTTTSKERLKALQQEINLISERNKLTEYDIEMMNLQYQLALAQIALEEAQASKDTVRLTRDEDGNMAYQYTADASKVSEAQQQYEDILQQINDLSANRVSELEQQFLEIQQNYRDTAQEILLDTNLTEEEKVAKLAALAEHSKNQMNYIQEQYGNASKHLMENQAAIAQQYGQSLIDTTDATSRQMNEMLANMIQNTQAQVELFDKAISGEGLEAFKQYLADIGVVLNTSGTSEDGLPGAAKDASDAAKEAAESADETAKKINSATAAVHAATEEWLKHAGALDSVRDSYVAIAEAIQKIVAAESGFSSDEGMAGIWEGTEDLAERQAQIIKQQQELLKNAQETIDTQIETEIINGKHLEDIGAAYEEHLNKIANTQADSNENITSTLLNQSEYLAIQESFVSQLSELLSDSNLQNMYGNATASILGFNGTNNGLIQQIELHADFSAAESAAEIKEALELFVQTASQYAYSTDRAPTAF